MDIKHRLADGVRSAIAYMKPVPTQTAFATHGTLTPNEFVEAGNHLTHRFPTWEWMSASKGRECHWLPNNKQYLLTRNVPCTKRVGEIEKQLASSNIDENGWFVTGSDTGDDTDDAYTCKCSKSHHSSNTLNTSVSAHSSLSKLSSLPSVNEWEILHNEPVPLLNQSSHHENDANQTSIFVEKTSNCTGKKHAKAQCNCLISLNKKQTELLTTTASTPICLERNEKCFAYSDKHTNLSNQRPDNTSPSIIPKSQSVVSQYLNSDNEEIEVIPNSTNVLKTRTYDISVTYDKYYQTPRVWLFGYDEHGIPLTPDETFEDILTDYISKTVTVDPHPCTGVPTASIHPCKHASVMKKIFIEWQEKGIEPRPDLAMLALLKFISGVIPTIDYDFTMDIEANVDAPCNIVKEPIIS